MKTITSLLRALLLLCLSSCSFRNDGLDPYREALLFTRSMTQQHGEIDDPRAVQYLEYLIGRLNDSLQPAQRPPQPFRVVLLDSMKPLALSPGGGFVLLSRGLVLKLGSEAELAFILSHEAAHEILGHTTEHLHNRERLPLTAYGPEFEMDADLYAVGLMALAGYDPRVAVFALDHGYRSNPGIAARSRLGLLDDPGGSHPDLFARTIAVTERIDGSGWRPPGTVNRRSFQKFKKLLYTRGQ